MQANTSKSPQTSGPAAFEQIESAAEPDFVAGAIDRNHEKAQLGAQRIADKMGILGEVRLIGGALVFILIVAFILFEVSEAVDVGDGPFAGIESDLETTGVAALGLLVIALLVVAASAIMRSMDRGGLGGR